MSVINQGSMPANHYKRWTADEETLVVSKYIAGMETENIAKLVKRTEYSVISKIVQIRNKPEPAQMSLHNLLVKTELPQQELHPMLGKHVIYAHKLHKISTVYTTLNGSVYVAFNGYTQLANVEEIKGSIVQQTYSL